MRKTKRLQIRISENLSDALNLLDNKTEYIKSLLIKDFKNQLNSRYKQQLKLEKQIEKIKKVGQIVNSGRVFLNLLSKADTQNTRNLLRKMFIDTLQAQRKLIEDDETISIIDDTIHAFQRTHKHNPEKVKEEYFKKYKQ